MASLFNRSEQESGLKCETTISDHGISSVESHPVEFCTHLESMPNETEDVLMAQHSIITTCIVVSFSLQVDSFLSIIRFIILQYECKKYKCLYYLYHGSPARPHACFCTFKAPQQLLHVSVILLSFGNAPVYSNSKVTIKNEAHCAFILRRSIITLHLPSLSRSCFNKNIINFLFSLFTIRRGEEKDNGKSCSHWPNSDSAYFDLFFFFFFFPPALFIHVRSHEFMQRCCSEKYNSWKVLSVVRCSGNYSHFSHLVACTILGQPVVLKYRGQLMACYLVTDRIVSFSLHVSVPVCRYDPKA